VVIPVERRGIVKVWGGFVMTEVSVASNLGDVIDKGRGAALRARREHLGMTVSDLAELASVDRGKLGRFESGKDVPSERWISGVERALDSFEAETGHEPGEAATKPPEAGFIRFKVEGVYGAKALVVEGPVENMAELEEMVDRVMRRLADGPTTE
jgi:transcriptional regulator with XRE-family HTH domain